MALWHSGNGRTRNHWITTTDRNAGVAVAGFILGVAFIVAIGFVGVPAVFLEPC